MSQTESNIIKQKSGGNTLFSVIVYFFIIISLSIFVSNLLFGKNSIQKYQNLKRDKELLSKKIDKIKHSNAALQREYFDLKSIMPQKDEEYE